MHCTTPTEEIVRHLRLRTVRAVDGPALLTRLIELMAVMEARSLQLGDSKHQVEPACQTQLSSDGELASATWLNTLDGEDGEMLDLIANPRILPFVTAMVDRPILEQFIIAFRWSGGEVGVHAGHTPYQAINSYQVNNGRIYTNHLRVMYYMSDVECGCGQGGLQIIPGVYSASHGMGVTDAGTL